MNFIIGGKDPNSIQGKALLQLQAETMIAMTGTPLMNSPLDLYMPIRWLGFENHNFYSFKNHYCIMRRIWKLSNNGI